MTGILFTPLNIDQLTTNVETTAEFKEDIAEKIPLPPAVIRIETIMPEGARLDDFIYGYSPYYNALKKLGKKEQLKKIDVKSEMFDFDKKDDSVPEKENKETKADDERNNSQEEELIEPMPGVSDEEKSNSNEQEALETTNEVSDEERNTSHEQELAESIDEISDEEKIIRDKQELIEPTSVLSDEEKSATNDQESMFPSGVVSNEEKNVSDEQDIMLPASTLNGEENNINHDQELMTLTNTLSSDKAFYNTLVGPSVMNGVNEQKYSEWSDMEEIISPQTGDLTIKNTDIVLPGRNGLDLAITRIYQSNQSLCGDRRVSGDGLTSYNDYSTYYLNRYALGLGWSLGFPSVEVKEEESQKELYYHTGSGSIYHVNFTADATDSNLEKYYRKDAEFKEETSFTNGQVTSKYAFETADKTKQYFAADGRLLGIVDRFGNIITFKHQEFPVANYAPNNDFEYPETAGVWTTNSYYSYDQANGKDDNTSLRFTSGATITASSLSKYIEVQPNTKYILSGYINNQLTNGNSQLTYREYNQYQSQINQGVLCTSTVKNTWESLSQSFTTSSNTRYIRIEFRNSNANGTAWLDKVRFDRAWPLISEITDTIGRKVTFTYHDTLYDDTSSDAGTITVAVIDPEQADSYTIVYTRGVTSRNFNWKYDGWIEERRYPYLYKYYDGEKNAYYRYFDNGVYYDFWRLNQSSYSGISCHLLLNEALIGHSRIVYYYGKTTKHLGANGFYETYRITDRNEYKLTVDYHTGPYHKKTYSYSGLYNGTTYDNETGYPYSTSLFENPNYQFTTTMQQTNGLKMEYIYKGAKEDKIINSNTSGEKETRYFEEYDTRFLDQVTKEKIETTNSSGSTTLYKGYTYNDWGGISSETKPLTPEQWNNTSIKNQNTVAYTYEPTYKFLATTTYYQLPTMQISETNNYDAQGRLIAYINGKNETTQYFYEDASHPGNCTKVIKGLDDSRTSMITYDYSGAYYAFPTAVTEYYTEDGTPKSSTTSRTYEFIRGNVKSLTDALGKTITYDYDGQGRIKTITYPVTKGRSGDYIIKDNYSYSIGAAPAELNGLYAFKVYHYQTKTMVGQTTSTTFARDENYYHDYGNLLLAKRYDYERNKYVSLIYGFNNYDQLAWIKDANNNQTNYVFDEWDRVKSVTDCQGNQYVYSYDILNRTNHTQFVPASTGVAENHYVETYDQWDRLVSRKAYPDGIDGPTVLEEKYEYDISGNLIKTIDPNNNITQFQYDPLNQLIKVTDAINQQVDYTYDKLGDLTEIKQYEDTSTFLTSRQYDERGKLIAKQQPMGETVTIKYNANGLPSQITDASGKVTAMQYADDGRLYETKINKDRIRWYFNPLGGVEKYEVWHDDTGYGEHLYYNYYSTGLTKQRQTGNRIVNFEYDILGNQTKVTDPFGLDVNYLYDNLNRINTITVEGKTFTYEYYADGMVKAVNSPILANGMVIRTEYTYDNANRLKMLKNLLGAQVISQYTYMYDNNGNIIAVTANGQTTNYTYDALNRLIGVQRPSGEQVSYQYDTRGNRIQTSGNEVAVEAFVPGSFSYNSWEQMGQFTTNGTTYEYKYDPEVLRTKKVGPAGKTTYHYNNNGEVIAESNDAGQFTAQNIWGNQVLARKVNGAYYYYVYNGHGDVVQVIDNSGNIVNSYEYDEWGNMAGEQEQIPNPIRYAGEYYDAESGLYYLRARYYDPTIGRFISEDSYEGTITNPLSLNLYTYCVNNPIRYIDPSGHILTEWDKKHLTKSEQKQIEKLTRQWEAGDKSAHKKAEKIRNKHRTSNERGRHDGYTIDKKTGKISNNSHVKGVSAEAQAGYVVGGKLGLQYVTDGKAGAIIGYFASGNLNGVSFGGSLGPIITNASKVNDMKGKFVVTGVSSNYGSVDISGSSNGKGKLILTVTPAGSPFPTKGIPYETHVMYGEAKILLRWYLNNEEFRKWRMYK